MITITDQLLNEVLNLFPDGVNMTDEQRKKVAEKLEQMNKKNVIDNHPYEISTIMKHGEEYFLTYVFDETKKNNRRQISAKTMQNLENKIYEAHKQKNLLTFEKVSREWLKYYKGKVKPQTFSRTMTDYNRFIPECSLAKKSIKQIETTDVEKYLEKTILDEKLQEQAYKNLKSLLNGIFKYARRRKYITDNPIDTIEVSTTNLVVLPKKSKEAVVFTNKERDLIKNHIMKDSANYKTSVPYAILLAFQLGLRVGELITLKWSDIEEKTKIHIQRQEIVYDVYDDDLNKIASSVHEVVEYTKTKAGERFLPLTPEARRILDSVKFWNKLHKIKSEYIFADVNGKNFNRQH